jgi:hypothetical protein
MNPTDGDEHAAMASITNPNRYRMKKPSERLSNARRVWLIAG